MTAVTRALAADDPFHGAGANLRRWQALALLFFAQMVAIGSISYGFSVLLKPLAADFGLQRVQVNRGLMIALVGTFRSPASRSLLLQPAGTGRRHLSVGSTALPAASSGLSRMSRMATTPGMSMITLITSESRTSLRRPAAAR